MHSRNDAYNDGFSDGQLYQALAQINPARPFVWEGISYDSDEGIGSTPNNSNVNYMGWTAWMTPHSFLRVNPPRIASTQRLFSHIETGLPIGPPMLYVKQEEIGWQVYAHEGRGRAAWVARQAGEFSLMPVHVIPSGEFEIRARDLQIPDVLLPFLPDKRGGSTKATAHAVTLQGKVTIDPYAWTQEPGVLADYEAGFKRGTQ